MIGSRQEGDIFRAVLSASKSKCLPINTCNYLEYSAKDAHECCIKELRYYMSKNEIKNTREKAENLHQYEWGSILAEETQLYRV